MAEDWAGSLQDYNNFVPQQFHMPTVPPPPQPEEYHKDIGLIDIPRYILPGGNNRITVDVAVEDIVNNVRQNVANGVDPATIAKTVQEDLQIWAEETNWTPDKFADYFNKQISKFPDVKRMLDMGGRALAVANAEQPQGSIAPQQGSAHMSMPRQVNVTDNSKGVVKSTAPAFNDDMIHLGANGQFNNKMPQPSMWKPDEGLINGVTRRF